MDGRSDAHHRRADELERRLLWLVVGRVRPSMQRLLWLVVGRVRPSILLAEPVEGVLFEVGALQERGNRLAVLLGYRREHALPASSSQCITANKES